MLIILSMLLFTIDYFAYVLLDAPIVLSLITIFFYFLSQQQNTANLIACIILIGLQSFLFYNISYLTLITLVPIALIGNYAHQFFIKTPCINILLIMGYILSNSLLAAILLKQPTLTQNYTIWQFCSTLGIIFGMSLIIRVAGTTDNRL